MKVCTAQQQKRRLPQQECRHRIAAQTTTKNKSLSSSMCDTFVERRIASKSAISENRADTEIASRAWRGQTRLNNTNNFVSFKLRLYCLLPSPGSGSRFLRDDKNVVTLHVVASKTKHIFRRQNKWGNVACHRKALNFEPHRKKEQQKKKNVSPEASDTMLCKSAW